MKKIVPLLLLLLPCLLLVPGLDGFPYPSPEASFSDFSLAHYPNAIFLRRTILEQGQIPLWSPNIMSGAPFFSNPLSGLWYIPGLCSLLFSLPFGLNLMIILHLIWGGLGMFSFLKAENVSYEAALFGALAFEFMPKLFAHYGAGHLTLLYAIPWTPWLLMAVHQEQVVVFGRRFAYLEAVILAIIFMADVRWAVYAGALWVCYSLFQRYVRIDGDRLKGLFESSVHFFRQVFIAILFAAPLALPLLEFTRLSSRAQLRTEDFFTYSLPIPRLLGLIFPDFQGFHEWVLYSGGIVLILGILSVIWFFSRKAISFWLCAALLSLTFALGTTIPIFYWFSRIPLLKLLRVPPRSLFISGIAIVILASYAVDRLLSDVTKGEARAIRLISLFLVGFSLSLTLGALLITRELVANFLWGTAVILTGVILINLRISDGIGKRAWIIAVLLICLLDWIVVDKSLFETRSADEVLQESRPVAEWLNTSLNEGSRVYSPSYSISQQTAADLRLQLVGGVDPLQLQSYVDFMEAASGIPLAGYSVTIPPFATGNPAEDNSSYQPDPKLLGLLNVDYVAAEYELIVEGLQFNTKIGDTRIYENQETLPRAWIQTQNTVLGQSVKSVEKIVWTPNRIEVFAQGPDLLVLSEVDYPGWRALVNGISAPIQSVAGLLRGVSLNPGMNHIVFTFRPLSLTAGLLLCAIGVLFVMATLIRNNQRNPEP